MPPLTLELQHGKTLTARQVLVWRLIQSAVFILGVGLLCSLLCFPETGLMLFWNLLIPVAPLMLVLAPGVWRNVCPLATVNLLPRHVNGSARKKLTRRQAGLFNLIGVLALYLIVPLRHPVFNHDGPATAILILAMVAIGAGLGFVYEWKSAWCSGLCPIHPVEKLYGEQTAVTVPNTHCHRCMNCVVPCPDSTPGMHPLLSANSPLHTISGWLIAGGLPGFIWGWFHVPDQYALSAGLDILQVYTLPFAGLLVSLSVFLFLYTLGGKKYERLLVGAFAAAGVTCYYWYRIPALIGLGSFADDGVLFDLHGTISPMVIPVVRAVVLSFFAYWFLWRTPSRKPWTLRPKFAERTSARG